MPIKEKEGSIPLDTMLNYVNSLMNCISTQSLTEDERSRKDFIGHSKDRILTIYGNLCKVTLLGDLPEKSESIEICFRTYCVIMPNLYNWRMDSVTMKPMLEDTKLNLLNWGSY